MKQRSITMCGRSVRAILEGRKTETRRVITPQPTHHDDGRWVWRMSKSTTLTLYDPPSVIVPVRRPCAPGDGLWLKETWCPMQDVEACARAGETIEVAYKADWDADGVTKEEAADVDVVWRSSRFMPRWASRIDLDVTGVRPERLCDIDLAGCIAEGIVCDGGEDEHREQYADWWDELNAKRGYAWASNPWIWVVKWPRYGTPKGESDASSESGGSGVGRLRAGWLSTAGVEHDAHRSGDDPA